MFERLFCIYIYYFEILQTIHLTPEQNARLMQNSLQCIVDTGVSPDAIVDVRNGKFSDDENFKKFLFCVFRKSGVANKNGSVKIDNVLAKYPKNINKEPIKKVLEECSKQEGKDAVNKSFNIFKCFHAKTPVHICL